MNEDVRRPVAFRPRARRNGHRDGRDDLAPRLQRAVTNGMSFHRIVNDGIPAREQSKRLAYGGGQRSGYPAAGEFAINPRSAPCEEDRCMKDALLGFFGEALATRDPALAHSPPVFIRRAKLAVAWSPRAACSHAVLWALRHEGLLEAANAHDAWPHTYRIEVYHRRPEYKQALSRLLWGRGSGLTLLRITPDEPAGFDLPPRLPVPVPA